MTKNQFSILIIFLSLTGLRGQQYEFGLTLGAGNYIGDIGQEYYFNPNKIGGGLLVKNTLNPWFSSRLNLNYYQIEAKDAESESLGRQERDISIDGGILSFSAGIEYNFFPRNPFIRPKPYQRFVPYIFSGVGVASYFGDFYKHESKVADYSGATLYIPMSIGIKYKAAEHFLISLEASANYYFTDDLDGTNSYYGSGYPTIPSTNLNSNDWYTFTSITLIYTFGDLKCYFNM